MVYRRFHCSRSLAQLIDPGVEHDHFRLAGLGRGAPAVGDRLAEPAGRIVQRDLLQVGLFFRVDFSQGRRRFLALAFELRFGFGQPAQLLIAILGRELDVLFDDLDLLGKLFLLVLAQLQPQGENLDFGLRSATFARPNTNASRCGASSSVAGSPLVGDLPDFGESPPLDGIASSSSCAVFSSSLLDLVSDSIAPWRSFSAASWSRRFSSSKKE